LVILRFEISDNGKLVSNWKEPELGLGKTTRMGEIFGGGGAG